MVELVTIRLLIVLVLSVPTLAWATAETLYVRPTADCANNGDGTAYACAASGGAAGAFKGASNVVYNTTDETAGSVDPGDTLYICGAHTGQFFYGPSDGSFPGSGTAGNRVTVSFACPSDAGSIDATGSGNYAFVTYQNYIDVVDPTLTGGAVNTFAFTTSAGTSTDERHNTITGGTIGQNTSTTEKCVHLRGRYIVVTGVTISQCGNDGIWATGKYIKVYDSVISQVSTASINGDCIQLSGEVDGGIFRGNSCDHSTVDSKYCYISSGDSDAGFVSIVDNICLKSIGDTVGSGIYVEHPAEIIGNYIFGGANGIDCISGNNEWCLAIGNVIVSPTTKGINFGSGANKGIACNNTIVSGSTGIYFSGNVAARACNNILYSQVTGINKSAGSTPTDDHNLFYGITGNNLLVSAAPASLGTGSVTNDPLFVGASDYRVRSSSPSRQAGAPFGLCSDTRMRPCPELPNIGAYQSTSGDPAATRAVRN